MHVNAETLTFKVILVAVTVFAVAILLQLATNGLSSGNVVSACNIVNGPGTGYICIASADSGIVSLTFADQGTNPVADGQVQRNGASLLYYDGSAAQTLFNGQSGEATIPAGDTFVDVAHNVGATPVRVIVTPKSEDGIGYWVDNIGASTFRVNLPVAQVGDSEFDWAAIAH